LTAADLAVLDAEDRVFASLILELGELAREETSAEEAGLRLIEIAWHELVQPLIRQRIERFGPPRGEE